MTNSEALEVLRDFPELDEPNGLYFELNASGEAMSAPDAEALEKARALVAAGFLAESVDGPFVFFALTATGEELCR